MPSEDLLAAARSALASGNPAEADRRLRQVLEDAPDHGEARHLLGLIAYRRGEAVNAREHLRASVAAEPGRGEAWAHLAEVHRSLEELDEAVAAARHAVELLPEWPPAHNNLGLALSEQEEFDEAEASLRRAIAVDPTYPRAHYNLGNVLRETDCLEEAEAAFRQALRLKPKYPQALNGLGVVLDLLGRPQEASAAFEGAIRIAPGDKKAFFNYGNLLCRGRRWDAALRCLDRALQIDAGYVEAWFSRATVFQQQERWKEALEAVRRGARLRPEDAEGPFRLGQVHFARGAYPEAVQAFTRALELEPEHRAAACARAQARGEVCDWREREADMARVRSAIAEARTEGEEDPLAPFVSFLPFEPYELLELADRASARMWRETSADRQALAALPRSRTGGRIRLGYLSSDFRSHAVAYSAGRLWALHDRARFEVRCYSIGPDDGSSYRQRIVDDCDVFVDLREVTDAEAARRIRDDEVDVLIDLSGFTKGSRPGIPARRPAPVQVSWLYPSTMGGRIHDYFIGDRIVTPPEHADRFAESLVLMPHCYHVADPEEPSERAFERADEGLPEEGFVFCCFNKLAKIDPRVFDSWMRILDAVPGSVLWMREWSAARANLGREAEARGISADRLRFSGLRTKAEHLTRHRLAGLFLDTTVFSAHSTAIDALWSGVPVLTLTGETFAARVCTSMLTAAEASELVLPDLETYERRAIELASAPEELGRLREKLTAQRGKVALFDTPRFARNLERAYSAMWERRRRGEEPGLLIIEEER